MNTDTRCGVVAVVGAPNVGKSSLINRLVGHDVSSVSFKPQTTRASVLGVLTEGNAQAILIDTPGIQTKHRHLLDRALTRSAARALTGADFALFLAECRKWRAEEERALEVVAQSGLPCFLCVTKVDKSADKRSLLPHLEELSARYAFAETFPVSAFDGTNIDVLRAAMLARLPVGPFGYPEGDEAANSVESRITEEIRTQLLFRLRQEVPHGAYVSLEFLEERASGLYAEAVIYVAKESLKPIVVGRRGESIKQIGIAARQRLEWALGRKLTLKLWVKIDLDWYNDATKLRKLGIHE